MINYWWQIEKNHTRYTLIIKANSDTLNVVDGFKTEDDAELYAMTYVRGYRDARGDFDE